MNLLDELNECQLNLSSPWAQLGSATWFSLSACTARCGVPPSRLPTALLAVRVTTASSIISLWGVSDMTQRAWASIHRAEWPTYRLPQTRQHMRATVYSSAPPAPAYLRPHGAPHTTAAPSFRSPRLSFLCTAPQQPIPRASPSWSVRTRCHCRVAAHILSCSQFGIAGFKHVIPRTHTAAL